MLTVLVLCLAASPDAGADEAPVFPQLPAMARAVAPQVKAPWVRRWLEAVSSLTPVTPSTWFCSKDKQRCAPQPPDGGVDWVERHVDAEFLYARISDPIAYARPFELLAQHGFTSPAGKKVLDLGYGNVGQLRMLAQLGADVHGVEVDALLPLAAAPLTGQVGAGRLTLHHGFYSGDAELRRALGGGYAVWLSKNTLKRGYVHPTNGRAGAIDLGADDATVLRRIYESLAPGGLFFLYNICPPETGEAVPWADGHSPFTRAALQAAGFEVLGFDEEDDAAVRALGRALGWGPEAATFKAWWTLARRPKR